MAGAPEFLRTEAGDDPRGGGLGRRLPPLLGEKLPAPRCFTHRDEEESCGRAANNPSRRQIRVQKKATMKPSETFKIEPSGEREIIMTRVFDAPRELVFDALTKPEFVQQWLFGPPGWSMPV